MSNKFGPSTILLDLENRKISQLKANQNMYHLLDTSLPMAARTELNFAKFLEKNLCGSLCFNKLQA